MICSEDFTGSATLRASYPMGDSMGKGAPTTSPVNENKCIFNFKLLPVCLKGKQELRNQM